MVMNYNYYIHYQVSLLSELAAFDSPRIFLVHLITKDVFYQSCHGAAGQLVNYDKRYCQVRTSGKSGWRVLAFD